MTRPTTERGPASMEHFTIATVAQQSTDFRRVLWTGKYAQLVIMTIPPGGEIGEEIHEDTDQILTFVSGTGEAIVSGKTRKVTQGDLVAVPSGHTHNFVNTGENPLILYTVYGPPHHADAAVHATKAEAEALEEAGRRRCRGSAGSGQCSRSCGCGRTAPPPGRPGSPCASCRTRSVSYTHLRAHETDSYIVCRRLIE